LNDRHAATALGRLCLQRVDFPQAMGLYQQAFRLAERLGDRRMQGVIYDQIGHATLPFARWQKPPVSGTLAAGEATASGGVVLVEGRMAGYAAPGEP